jgi:hypothetical protein
MWFTIGIDSSGHFNMTLCANAQACLGSNKLLGVLWTLSRDFSVACGTSPDPKEASMTQLS